MPPSELRIYHGDIQPGDFARALVAAFNRSTLRVQQFGSGEKIAVQIATGSQPERGGQTALTVQLQRVSDGVAVQLGQQAWLGVAASLGMTALSAWRNPWSLLARLDDLAQDIENLHLSDQVWETIDQVARSHGAAFELSERLRRLVCDYCRTANPTGAGSCIACGAPLGGVQPRTCSNCGFVVRSSESVCPNCKKPL
jgi:RNA polymerase subunit RPABC4/transcription elongation factor Spt4